MKNIVLVVGIAILSLTSCQFTEKIYINEDGSGTFDFEIDMSQMMQSLKSLDTDKKENDSTKVKEYLVKDTIFNFADILEEHKDSIAKLPKEEQQKLEHLKDMKMRIYEDEEQGKMKMNYLIDFKNVNELQDIQNMMSNANSLEKGEDKSIPTKSEMRFSFKRNKFKRIVLNKKLTKTEEEKYNKSIESSAMFLDGSAYNLEYHFPRAIKSTTIKDATFSADKKIMYVKKTFKEVTDSPSILDFEVILE